MASTKKVCDVNLARVLYLHIISTNRTFVNLGTGTSALELELELELELILLASLFRVP